MQEQTKNKPFTLRARLRSFTHAARGIRTLLRHEHNARIHLIAALIALALAAYLHLAPLEWVALLASIAAVFAAELFNTAIEAICNLVSPEYHPLVKNAKDCAAAGVLISALLALSIGMIIFIPKLARLFFDSSL